MLDSTCAIFLIFVQIKFMNNYEFKKMSRDLEQPAKVFRISRQLILCSKFQSGGIYLLVFANEMLLGICRLLELGKKPSCEFHGMKKE